MNAVWVTAHTNSVDTHIIEYQFIYKEKSSTLFSQFCR
ncbi:hypothetical protein M2387_002791 [Klebsiella sp. BIGb0407]|nr:hypothetical protein [Klebsiella sp. BIGb0407]